ncbi:MAG: efflux RND transporter permease subunit, partial [Halochromatium sp.]
MAESHPTPTAPATATAQEGRFGTPGQNALGVSGRIAQRFQQAEITPLLALVGLLLGLFAILITPREEEPQINVTFADVLIPFPGASASEVEHLVAGPAEQVLSEIQGVEHVYSVSRPGMALISVQFEVGEDRTEAIVRLWSKVNSNADWLPDSLGVAQPLIKPKGIDNVPILTATLWSADTQLGAYELGQVAHAIEQELKRVPGTRDVYTVGAPQQVMRVILDPQALASHDIDLTDLSRALQASNHSRDDIAIVADNREIRVQAGTMLASVDDIAELVVGMHGGRPVYLREVARIERGPEVPQAYVWMGAGASASASTSADDDAGSGAGIDSVTAADGQVLAGTTPAVTIAVAKQEGTNAVAVAEQIIARFDQLSGIFIPEGVEVSITRNDGKTADAKARKLITELASATITVIVLVALAMGWRAGLVVGGAVIVTLMLTLFASWAYGFTLNRVSLFALIFSIGILVDDAIVVVENIIRHMAIGRRKMLDLMPEAVDEVGSPTILATFTVIAALLPMAFVSGLMGPYMSPIPINASMGMVISQVVAFVLTPWLAYQVLGRRHDAALADHTHHAPQDEPAGVTSGQDGASLSPAPGGDAAQQDATSPHLAPDGGVGPQDQAKPRLAHGAEDALTPAHQNGAKDEDAANPRLQWLFERLITPFLEGRRGLINRWLLLAGILLL